MDFFQIFDNLDVNNKKKLKIKYKIKKALKKSIITNKQLNKEKHKAIQLTFPNINVGQDILIDNLYNDFKELNNKCCVCFEYSDGKLDCTSSETDNKNYHYICHFCFENLKKDKILIECPLCRKKHKVCKSLNIIIEFKNVNNIYSKLKKELKYYNFKKLFLRI